MCLILLKMLRVICSDLLQFKLPSMDINNILIVLIYCNIGDISFKSL